MFKEYFIVLLLTHIIGDFYIQTNEMTRKKEEKIAWVFRHCLYYWITVLIISVPIMSWKVLISGTMLAVIHTIINTSKYLYIVKRKKDEKLTVLTERNIFFVEQILYFICLVLIAYFFALGKNSLRLDSNIAQFFTIVGISEIVLMSWVVSLLIIHKPTNIAISKLLMIYKPKSMEEEQKKDYNAGRFIGTIERIIILIFISIGQYSAIGLVLTAKSIARYDKIAKEKDFAEYYLLGTLISTAVVIVISFII